MRKEAGRLYVNIIEKLRDSLFWKRKALIRLGIIN